MSGGTVLADNHPIVSTETLPRWNRLQAGLLRPSRGHTYSHPTTMDKRPRSYTKQNYRQLLGSLEELDGLAPLLANRPRCNSTTR